MTQYLIEASTVRNAETGEVDPALIGQSITVVERGTTTPVTIREQGTLDPISGSLLTVTTAYTLPPFILDDADIGTDPEDLYLDWYDAGSGKRGPIGFEAVMREIAKEARTAAEAAEAATTGVVRSINGQVPDENGAITVSGAGGSGVLVLAEAEAVPVGTPSGTLIARSASAEPPGQMEVITSTKTTGSATSASEVSLAVPSGVVAGDLLVAVATVHSQNGTATAPAGWVKLQELPTNTSDFRTTTVWGYPVPTSGDIPAGSQLFSWNVGGRVAGAMFRVTGADLTTPVLANGAAGGRVQGTYSVPALTGSADGLVLSIAVGQISSSATPYPLVYSETMETFVSIDTGVDAGNNRTIVGIAWAMAEAGDWPANTVAVADDTVNAFGVQVLALRSDA